jgi:hypothetical protein
MGVALELLLFICYLNSTPLPLLTIQTQQIKKKVCTNFFLALQRDMYIYGCGVRIHLERERERERVCVSFHGIEKFCSKNFCFG